MEKNLFVGIDIGGTSVKLSFIDKEGRIKEKWEIPTNTNDNGKHIVGDIKKSLHKQMVSRGIKQSMIKSIGIGAPGFVEVDRGFIYEAVNLGWKNYHLKSEMEREIGIPTFVDNDANLAAAGEMWRGAGNGANNVLCVTLGTGVGGGIVAGGEIVHGQFGMAGEIGHITVVLKDGAPCNCGKSGCLETVSSATGIVRLAKEGVQATPSSILNKVYEHQGDITSKDVLDAAKGNDAFALKVVNESMNYLGLALANLANAINPEIIVIGGGVSRAGDYLLSMISKSFSTYAIPKIASDTKIRLAILGNDAGVIGAAWLGKQRSM
ncbi:ROK family glucokinase [Evansella sp. AB-P1]|uniref:ROK family glucokinase n=1 Tax=Evansella sp. AB-P1 TaxID=3037653 RepID=UPI00241C9A93|nr:ROK family glucokinase [Evansella sp. AB-P1]MDG5788737.1 ROK family glucokinase [Evansella sp. AB-P1]